MEDFFKTTCIQIEPNTTKQFSRWQLTETNTRHSNVITFIPTPVTSTPN